MKSRVSDEAVKGKRDDGRQIWDEVPIWMKSSCSIRASGSQEGVLPGRGTVVQKEQSKVREMMEGKFGIKFPSGWSPVVPSEYLKIWGEFFGDRGRWFREGMIR